MQIDRELWRPIPSLPGWIVSTLGRVMRVPHLATMPNGSLRPYGGTPRYGSWCKDQRRYIIVHERRTYKVARLVCEAFHGAAPDDKPVCMHLDENSRNNRPDNLAWGTQKENLNAPGFLHYCRGRTGEDNLFVKGRLAA